VPALPDATTSNATTFLRGAISALRSVFSLVLFGTYIGMGALAHDLGFSVWWLALSSMLVWAAPAQVILISSLGAGAAPIEVAIAVSLSGIRLLPMVVALLPLLRGKGTRGRDLLLPTHFTSISMWIESLRLLPQMPHERRIVFCNGLSVAYMATAVISGFIGFYLAAGLPTLFAGALLFITPMSFLVSTTRNARALLDRVALAAGLVIGPILAYWRVELDLMWTGVIGGAAAYGVHRVREALR